MENNKPKFTPEQQAAITHRGGSLLVSSAAGSGKTMVLVERLLGYIDEKRNIDEFLVITYTRAAAMELRERIYEQLQKRLSESPKNMHLRRQAMLCRGASIDTIHTFCGTLLRENAHLVGLPPDFRIVDENECEMIKKIALDDVFNRTYENIEQEGVRQLLEMLAPKWDDKKIVETVSEIYAQIRSIPNYGDWIFDQIEKEQQIDFTGIEQTDYGKYLMGTLSCRVEQNYRIMIALQEEMSAYPDFEKKYGKVVGEQIEFTKTLYNSLLNSWNEAVEHTDLQLSRASGISGYDELKARRNWCIEELRKIIKILNGSSADHNKDMKTMFPVIVKLLQLTLEFDNAYAEEKRKRGVVDFSDLEHLTLSLLYDKKSGKKTQLAIATSKRFIEILIDEYQDVNEVQEMLFNALSQESNNVFMVGDVKQSIYRFRLADPSIFLKKYREFEEYSPEGENEFQNTTSTQNTQNAQNTTNAPNTQNAAETPNTQKIKNATIKPTKINLSMNFRSQAGILETVNHVFRNLMSESFGEMEYTDAEALIAGRNSEKGNQGIPYQNITTPAAATEFDILSLATLPESEEESPTAIQLEAAHVAKRIKELVDEPFMVEEKDGGVRPIRYSDIAILSRSVKGVTWRYASELTKLGIPHDMNENESYFGTVEVASVLSLLSVIDNPLQDIPLAAVLSGPIYGLSSDELAEIRAQDMSISYYEALKWSQEPDIVSESTACKCREILAEIETLRSIAGDLPADRFIWNAYNSTGLLNKFATMKGGKKRKGNLLALAELAQNYEKNGYKGLFSFLSFIETMRERDVDIIGALGGRYGSSDDGDAVKILSIHKSKGLEFPVVFLVNTAKAHNKSDLNKSFVFHKQMGLGGKLTDMDKRVRYNTLARASIVERLKHELLSEELRVLYVAMTRAREKLVIAATFSDVQKKIDKVNMLADEGGMYAPEVLMSYNSIAEWLIAGMKNIKSDCAAINLVGHDAPNTPPAPKPNSQLSTLNSQLPPSPQQPPNTFQPYKYPYAAATHLPSKITVTGLKSIIDPEAENAPWTRSTDTQKEAYTRKPLFVAARGKMTGAERGTLIHDIMSYIDYNKCSNESEMRKDLQRLVKSGLLEENGVAQVDGFIAKIVTLFKSDLGKRMAKAARIEREVRFSLLTPARQYFADGGDDEILLQGIIDCYFEEDGEFVVIDFKSDRVDSETIADRVRKYTPQIEGYSKALERMTKKKVKERILYFFATDTAVSV